MYTLRSAARRRLDRRCCRRNAAWHLHMFGMMVNKGWGGSRPCEDDRAAAPSTVRLGGGTRRYRWEVRAGSGQRARSAHSHARELGKSVRSAVSFAGMPGLVDADRARRARGRSAGEGLRHGCVPLSWRRKKSVQGRTRMPPSSRRRCCSSTKATVRVLLRFGVRAKFTKLQLGRRRLGRRRPDLKQGHESWREHRAEAREHGQGQW